MRRNIIPILLLLTYLANSVSAQATRYVIDPDFKPPFCLTGGDKVFLDEKDRLHWIGFSYNLYCLMDSFPHIDPEFQTRFSRLDRKTGWYDMNFNSGLGKGANQNWVCKILYGRARYMWQTSAIPHALLDDGSIDSSIHRTGSIRLIGDAWGGMFDACETLDSGILVVGNMYPMGTNSLETGRHIWRLDKNNAVDTSFYSPELIGSKISNTVVISPYLGNDRYILGGNFRKWDREDREQAGIVRIFANGTQDTSFHSPITRGVVDLLKVLDDGKILIGGAFWFKDYPDPEPDPINDPNPRYRFARLHPDGSLDLSFNFTNNVYGAIDDFKFLDPNKMIIVGSFTKYQDKPRGGIAIADYDGYILEEYFDTEGFRGNHSHIPDGTSSVRQVLPLGGDTLVIAGYFQKYDGHQLGSSGLVKLIPGRTRHTPVSPPVEKKDDELTPINPLTGGLDNHTKIEPDVSIYPNPATNYLTLLNDRQMVSVQILSPEGGTVLKSLKIGSDSFQIPIEEIRPGLYLIRIRYPDGSFSNHSFIKN